jgi:hypothetical protein
VGEDVDGLAEGPPLLDRQRAARAAGARAEETLEQRVERGAARRGWRVGGDGRERELPQAREEPTGRALDKEVLGAAWNSSRREQPHDRDGDRLLALGRTRDARRQVGRRARARGLARARGAPLGL